MYRKTEALAVHGAKIMQNLEFTKNGKTILFYQNEGDAKYRFKIKDDADLTHWLLLNTKTHRIREDKIKYAVKGIFEKLKEYKPVTTQNEQKFNYTPTLHSVYPDKYLLLESLGIKHNINPFNQVSTNRPNYVNRLLSHIDEYLCNIYKETECKIYYNFSEKESKEFFDKNEVGGLLDLTLNLKDERLSEIISELEMAFNYIINTDVKKAYHFTNAFFKAFLEGLKERYSSSLVVRLIEKIYFKHNYNSFIIDFGDNTQIYLQYHYDNYKIPQEALLECILYKFKKNNTDERFRITLQDKDNYYREILTDVRTGYFGIDSLLEHLKI